MHNIQIGPYQITLTRTALDVAPASSLPPILDDLRNLAARAVATEDHRLLGGILFGVLGCCHQRRHLLLLAQIIRQLAERVLPELERLQRDQVARQILTPEECHDVQN